MKVAIIVDFLIEENGGAQKVVEQFLEMYPKADIYTTTFAGERFSPCSVFTTKNQEGKIFTGLSHTILKSLPFVVKKLSYYHFFWLYFLDSWVRKVEGYDLVLVSLCANAKLFKINNCKQTVVYCHAPTRYFYPELMAAQDYQYLGNLQKMILAVCKVFLYPLERLGVQRMKEAGAKWLANSSFIASLLEKHYQVKAQVINPTIYNPSLSDIVRQPGDFYLYHGRLTFQKRVDLAVRAALLAGINLKISGAPTAPEVGSKLEQIVEQVKSENQGKKLGTVEFLGRTSNEQLRELMSQCKALLFTPKEDFGIVPLEVMAAGVPVIAFGKGGVMDYLQEGVNGLSFSEQSWESIVAALEKFETMRFEPQSVKQSVDKLSSVTFREKMHNYIRSSVQSNPSIRLMPISGIGGTMEEAAVTINRK